MSKFLDRYNQRFNSVQESIGLLEYLEEAKTNKEMYLNPAERILKAIGEPVLLNTKDNKEDPGLGRLYNNSILRIYPSIGDHYLGQHQVIADVVSFLRSAARGLEASKQILYLLGPVGGGKSTLAEILKRLMEKEPFYSLAVETKGGLVLSPIHENPLGLFSSTDEDELGIPGHYLSGRVSPWLTKRITELKGDITKLKVVKVYPDEARHIAVAKTEPGDENNQDISSLVGKLDISKAGEVAQSDPDCYEFSGSLCRANRGLMEFVEMFKAPIKMLHPLLTATQEHNYNPTEQIPSIPFEGIIVAHSNVKEWDKFRTNKDNEAFIDRTHVIKVPYEMRKDNVVKILTKEINKGALKDLPTDPHLFDVAAVLQLSSVLTLNPKDDEDMLTKIRIYNGENLKDEKPRARSYQDHRELESNVDEGMDSSLSLRTMFKLLANVYDKPKEEVSANTVDLLLLVDDEIAKIDDANKRALISKIKQQIADKYLQSLEEDIQEAYLGDFAGSGQQMYESYISMAEAWLHQGDYTDPDDEDSKFNPDMINDKLSELEKPAGIANPKEFRQEMINYTLHYRAKNHGKFPSWKNHQKIQEVIKKSLLTDFNKYISVIVNDKVMSTEQKEVLSTFTKEFKKKGYKTDYQIKRVINYWDKNRVK